MAETNSTRRHRRRITGPPTPQGSTSERIISGTVGALAYSGYPVPADQELWSDAYDRDEDSRQVIPS